MYEGRCGRRHLRRVSIQPITGRSAAHPRHRSTQISAYSSRGATVQNMRSLIPIFSPIFLLYVHRLHQDKRAAHRRESPTRPITVQLSSQSFALSPLHSSWLDDAKPPHRHIPFHQMQSSKIASHPFTAPSPTQLARRTDPINHPEMQCIQPTKHSLATPETAFPTVVPLAHPHAQLL